MHTPLNYMFKRVWKYKSTSAPLFICIKIHRVAVQREDVQLVFFSTASAFWGSEPKCFPSLLTQSHHVCCTEMDSQLWWLHWFLPAEGNSQVKAVRPSSSGRLQSKWQILALRPYKDLFPPKFPQIQITCGLFYHVRHTLHRGTSRRWA